MTTDGVKSDHATNTTTQSSVAVTVRDVLAKQGGISNARALDDHTDLYTAGLTSLQTVGVMLALEARFDIEFPEGMLSRGTFRSIASIVEAVSGLAR